MGQKVNPIIFRLGKSKNWESKYFEKKSNDLSIYTYKNLEIKEFIRKFFKNHGLLVHNTKFYYSENSLQIFISYFLSQKFFFLLKNLHKNQNIRIVPSKRRKSYKKTKKYKQKYNKLVNHIREYYNYKELEYEEKLLKTFSKKDLKIAKNAINIENETIKYRRLRILRYFKKSSLLKKHKTLKEINHNNFLENFFESIATFTNKKFNIFLTLKQINKNISKIKSIKTFKTVKAGIAQIRKYEQNDFFKNGVNLMLYCITNKNSSYLLAEFIADTLKKLKRHNFFLKFIKTTLSKFSKKKCSCVKGIKIKIKGRFNRRPRAKSKTITIKNGVPMMDVKTKLDYSEATSFTANGTFGVKVWIY